MVNFRCMTYDQNLADRIRKHLAEQGITTVEEKKMFRGLAFMVNGKMCINVSGDKLMCRFNPDLSDLVAQRKGYEPMVMKGKELTGYCYVHPGGFETNKDFTYWVSLCLDFNKDAKASKKKKIKS